MGCWGCCIGYGLCMPACIAVGKPGEKMGAFSLKTNGCCEPRLGGIWSRDSWRGWVAVMSRDRAGDAQETRTTPEPASRVSKKPWYVLSRKVAYAGVGDEQEQANNIL